MLCVRRLVIEIDGNAEIAREDVARNVRDQSDRPSRHIDAVDAAGVETICEDAIAGAIVGVLPNPAWA